MFQRKLPKHPFGSTWSISHLCVCVWFALVNVFFGLCWGAQLRAGVISPGHTPGMLSHSHPRRAVVPPAHQGCSFFFQYLSFPDLALAEPYHPQHTSALAPGMIPAPSRLLPDTKGWPGTENPAVSHLVCEGDQLLLKATQTCRSQGAISSPASPQEAEQGPHSIQFVASSCIRVLTQRNLLIREGSGGSCPAFPQCHKDNRRKHSPLLSSKPPAPLISLPTFSSGSSHWSFNHHHSHCLPFHPPSAEQQAQTQQSKLGGATAGPGRRARCSSEQGLSRR